MIDLEIETLEVTEKVRFTNGSQHEVTWKDKLFTGMRISLTEFHEIVELPTDVRMNLLAKFYLKGTIDHVQTDFFSETNKRNI